jgi:hypothetical protein
MKPLAVGIAAAIVAFAALTIWAADQFERVCLHYRGEG